MPVSPPPAVRPATPTLTLCLVAGLATPAAAQSDPSLFDTVINAPPTVIGSGQSIGSSTQLNVSDGGTVADSFDAGALDGSSSNVEVNISGGTVGLLFDANAGSTVNISGGTVGRGFDANDGSVVNISGGTVDSLFCARPGSTVNISGGTFGPAVNAFPGSVINISGGTFGVDFNAFSGSTVELVGGEFRLNGAAFTGPTITLAGGDVFTGTLADGSVFVFSGAASDDLSDVTLTPASLPTPDTTPIVVDSANPVGPSGLRAGQTLTLRDGGTLNPNFAVIDNTALTVEGGFVADGLEVAGSKVNITGGTVGERFHANAGSTVNISGGTVGDNFIARSRSEVNISGGTVGDDFSAVGEVNISGGTVGRFFDASGEVNISGGTVGNSSRALFGSEVNIFGGTVGDNFIANSRSEVNISGGFVGSGFLAHSGSTVNISGGTVGNFFNSFSGSEVNLLGLEFFLDGVELTGLSLQEPFEITDRGRDVALSGLLADGSAFSFDLNSTFDPFVSREVDSFHPDATLTVTLVPEPVLLGDLNGDGVLDIDDLDLLGSNIGTGTTEAEGDLDGDGDVDTDDLTALLTGLGTVAGDANLDQLVDTSDLAILAGNFDTSVDSYALADFNLDGVVDTPDLAILAGAFGTDLSGAAVAPAIPEPTTLVLLGAAAPLLLRRRAA
ncbi:MAG: hypothetical protein AAF078_06550 [Planctomycetota bacterium]